MGKFKTGLVWEQVAAEETAKEQQHLHEKHHIEDENVVVVEKSGAVKFTVRTLGTIIRTLALIVLVVFAAIGIAALLYPEPREALVKVFLEDFGQIKGYVGI